MRELDPRIASPFLPTTSGGNPGGGGITPAGPTITTGITIIAISGLPPYQTGRIVGCPELDDVGIVRKNPSFIPRSGFYTYGSVVLVTNLVVKPTMVFVVVEKVPVSKAVCGAIVIEFGITPVWKTWGPPTSFGARGLFGQMVLEMEKECSLSFQIPRIRQRFDLDGWLIHHIWVSYSPEARTTTSFPRYSLIDILGRCASNFSATDPRDYIYAFLGHPSYAEIGGNLILAPENQAKSFTLLC